MTTPYERIERNIYQRRSRYYVYVLRLGKRHFIGQYKTISEANGARDRFEAANPRRNPWSLVRERKPRKTRIDYYNERKAAGLCVHCDDKSMPGKVSCKECARIQKMKRDEKGKR